MQSIHPCDDVFTQRNSNIFGQFSCNPRSNKHRDKCRLGLIFDNILTHLICCKIEELVIHLKISPFFVR